MRSTLSRPADSVFRDGKNTTSLVEEILRQWPLRKMCERVGIVLPERGKFCSPFRKDKKPSCEIFDDKIRDRTMGKSYDSIQVFAEIKGLTNPEAIKQLALELHGGCRRPPKSAPVKRELVLPDLSYDTTLGNQLAVLRKLSPMGPTIAGVTLGCLGFGSVFGHLSWILTDSAGKIAEARRMDGKVFPAAGTLSERKAHTLRGSCKSWPLGIMPPRFDALPPEIPVVLVEGGPDYLAACDVLSFAKTDFLPVAMLGAGTAINASSLAFFAGRAVRVMAHPDEAGLTGAKRWAEQLRQAKATPSLSQLEGGDLNELVADHGAERVAAELGL